jgi:hypothetical protein
MISGFPKASLYFFFALIFAIFLAYFLNFVVEFPFYDDYYLLFKSLVYFNEAQSLYEMLRAVFLQHNEHRVFTHRALLLLLTSISGKVNVEVMLLIGNLTMLAISLILVRLFRTFDKTAYIIPIALLLFQPQQHINMFGSYGIYNNGVILYAFLSIYLLVNGGFDRYLQLSLAILMAFLATFSNGNGLVVWGAGAVLLLLNKQYRFLTIWVFCMMVSIVLFFKWDYEMSIGPKKDFDLQALAAFLTFAVRIIGGAGIIPTDNLIQSDVITAFVIVFEIGALYLLCKWLVMRRFQNIPSRYNLLLGFLLFLFGTCILLSYFRSAKGAVNYPTDYYRIYSLLIFILCFLIYLVELKPKFNTAIGITVLSFSLIFYAASYIRYTPWIVVNFRNTLLADQLNYLAGKKVLFYPYINGFEGYGSAVHAMKCLDLVVDNGQYVVPGGEKLQRVRALLTAPDSNADDIPLTIHTLENHSTMISNTTFYDPVTVLGTHPKIILKNGDDLFFFPTCRNTRLFLLRPYHPGFSAEIHQDVYKNLIPNGDYEVYILVSDSKDQPLRVVKTGQTIQNSAYVAPAPWAYPRI